MLLRRYHQIPYFLGSNLEKRQSEINLVLKVELNKQKKKKKKGRWVSFNAKVKCESL